MAPTLVTQDGAERPSTSSPSTAANILNGQYELITHEGISQYGMQGKGASACGIIAFNFVRIVLQRRRAAMSDTAFLEDIISRKTLEHVVAISDLWMEQTHLEVEAIAAAPIFKDTLILEQTKYGQPSQVGFTNLLRELNDISKSSAAIITRPPEIIACVKILTLGEPVYAIFDSHPRPQHPSGAGLVFPGSLFKAAKYLTELLPVDRNISEDPELQWQAALLGQYSGHIFVATTQQDKSFRSLQDTILKTSLNLLNLQAQVERLEAHNGELEQRMRNMARLETDVQRLKYQNAELERGNRRLQSNIYRLEGVEQSFLQLMYKQGDHRANERTQSVASVQNPARDTEEISSLSRQFGKMDAYVREHWQAFRQSGGSERSREHQSMPPHAEHRNGRNETTYQMPGRYEQPTVQRSQNRIGNGSTASGHARGLSQGSDRTDNLYHNIHRGSHNIALPTYHEQRRNGIESTPANNSNLLDPSIQLALQMQQEFDAEDTQLREQLMEASTFQNRFDQEDVAIREQDRNLRSVASPTFECGICMDTYDVDWVAIVEGCDHRFCRECICRAISSKLKDQRFPVTCPSCSVSQVAEPSVITENLAHSVGITEEEATMWRDFQLASVSILLHCRKCQRSVYVDRQEHDQVSILTCPLYDCDHSWCKTCSAAVVVGAQPPHSCDGTSEFNHLITSSGWKRCPGCQTTIQKESGCNHMTCVSPGCNTHFCYICGDSIIQSASPNAIKESVSAHFRRCQLFAVPEVDTT